MRRAFYAFLVFFGALLLFEVQPLLGKRLLPWFGGSPATWTICMLFFQGLLFAGYALADLAIRRGSLRTQIALELCLCGAALALLPLGPWPADRLGVTTEPVLAILGLLTRHAGLPYLALATTAPIVQHWYQRATSRSPYGLYAFSNAGSLLGLLAYPLFIEPWLATAQQARAWSWGFALFAAAIGVTGFSTARHAPAASVVGPTATATATATASVPGAHERVRWFALSAVPSTFLLAVTNYITVDIAPAPFLWVAPLALYLLSFVLTFGSQRFYRRALFLPLWVVCTAALGISLFQQGSAPLLQQLAVFVVSLFVCCMLCHGELQRARPAPDQLSRFYLVVAAGGAAGGVLVGAIAPLIFTGFFELQLAVIATHALLLWILLREPESAAKRAQLRWTLLGFGLGVPLIAATLWVQGQDRTRGGIVVEQRRSFYGVLRVTELADVTLLSHGRIRHGMQFRDPARAAQPTLYFGPDSGAGRALRLHALERPRRIGVLGLGVGTLACYGRAQDRLRFYELSPDVVDVARRRFSFLGRTPATVAIAVGDGRLSLEREPKQDFDLLVLDAFSSDSVPVHLLTFEAFASYLRHLRRDGLLLANVSNRHLDVERVVAGSAARYGLALRLLETKSDAQRGYARVRWALLSRDRVELDRVVAGAPPTALRGAPLQWTDEFSNLLRILRR